MCMCLFLYLAHHYRALLAQPLNSTPVKYLDSGDVVAKFLSARFVRSRCFSSALLAADNCQISQYWPDLDVDAFIYPG